MMNPCQNEKLRMIEPYTDQEILEIINVLGFKEENKMLWEKGCTDLRKNLKLLRAYSGDVNLILDKIAQIPFLNWMKQFDSKVSCCKLLEEEEKIESFSSNEMAKFELKTRLDCYNQLRIVIGKGSFRKPKDILVKNEKLLIEIVNAGYTKQNQILIDYDFLCYQKNLEALKKFQGDLPKCIFWLRELNQKYDEESKRDKIVKQYKDKAKMRMLQELNKLGYLNAYKKLIAGGQTKLTKNYQDLIYFNGDASKILKRIEIERKLKNAEGLSGIKFQKRIDKINENIDSFILDGTSSLCADEKTIIYLKLKQKSKGEKLVAITAKRFSSKGQGFHYIIFFDQVNFASEQINISEKSKYLSFNIYNSKPKYHGTDEAILDLLIKKPCNLKNTMFVTNNTELAACLLERGVTEIMTSANWFMLAKKAIGTEEFDRISCPCFLCIADI